MEMVPLRVLFVLTEVSGGGGGGGGIIIARTLHDGESCEKGVFVGIERRRFHKMEWCLIAALKRSIVVSGKGWGVVV